MKVKCKNNQKAEESLTIGQYYEIVEERGNYYLLKDNDDFVIEFGKWRFE